MRRIPDVARFACFTLACALCCGLNLADTANANPQEFEASLRDKITRNPQDGAAWRLLGRQRLRQGDVPAAVRMLRQATLLSPESAAAHYDLGRALLESGEIPEAVEHLQQVVALAPDSSYARQAEGLLEGLGAAPGSELQPAGFEVQSFDGSERSDVMEAVPPLTIPPPRPTGRLAVGGLYNSNVSLAPSSRELSPGNPASAQLYISPEIDLPVFSHEDWRAGLLFCGHFNFNEQEFRDFNLQSYQPGAYLERTILSGSTLIIPRLQYDFTHDEFDARTFANRHAVTLSSIVSWDEVHASYLGWLSDYTDFAEDGAVPAITSRDGWTNTLTGSHTVFLRRRWLESIRVGADLQRADTAGTDYTYNGVNLFAVAEVPLADRWTLRVRGGWGFRAYPEFQFDPSRDEHIWRAGARLQYDITRNLSAAAVFHYDRFDSGNPLFESQRTLVGGEMAWEF